jgi:hypothetical protein
MPCRAFRECYESGTAIIRDVANEVRRPFESKADLRFEQVRTPECYVEFSVPQDVTMLSSEGQPDCERVASEATVAGSRVGNTRRDPRAERPLGAKLEDLTRSTKRGQKKIVLPVHPASEERYAVGN